MLDVLKPIWTKIPETARRVRQRMRTMFRCAKVDCSQNHFRDEDGTVRPTRLSPP